MNLKYITVGFLQLSRHCIQPKKFTKTVITYSANIVALQIIKSPILSFPLNESRHKQKRSLKYKFVSSFKPVSLVEIQAAEI